MLLMHSNSLVVPLLEEAIGDCALNLLDEDGIDNGNGNTHTNTNTNMNSMSFNPVVKGENGTRVHARLIHLPPHSTNCKPSLSSLSTCDVGKILQLSGTVVRASKIQMYESQRSYKCCERKGCGTSFTVNADLQQWNNALVPPSRCVW